MNHEQGEESNAGVPEEESTLGVEEGTESEVSETGASDSAE